VARILMGPEERRKEVIKPFASWTFEHFKQIINRITNIEELQKLEGAISESEATTPIERIELRKLVSQRELDIRRQTPERLREDDIIKDDDVMQVPGDITEWEFGDFEGQIPGLDDPEDLEVLLEYTDVSDKLAKDEAKTLREMIKERIRKVEKAGS
ncbi:MAG: hypothetical protein ABIK52_06640, partial [Bacteroidota bacterium]